MHHQRLTPREALDLFQNAPLAELGARAAQLKEQISGRNVFYNRNIHIEPTNICLFRCEFCSYRRAQGEAGAWYLSLDEIENIARTQIGKPITEVHIVGGVHPDHDLDYYCEMIARVKRILPHVAIKAYTAVELYYIIEKAGLSLEEGLKMLKESGMEAIPGGGAEIFAPEIRRQICPDKPSADQWLQTHEAAHGLGIPTNATILYGHIESPLHIIDHLDRLRTLQDKTGGFDAFIPLKFRRANNKLGLDTPEASIVQDMRMVAIARLYLDNFPHIKAYWPMYGAQTAQLALAFGADDIDGTIDDSTKIYSMAGADDTKPVMTTDDMRKLICGAGYKPVERDTHYKPV